MPPERREESDPSDLVVTVACFAVAIALVCVGLYEPVSEIGYLPLYVLSPLIGAACGLGVGAVIGHKFHGLMAGLALTIIGAHVLMLVDLWS